MFGGGKFGNLFADELTDAFVRRPGGLTEADGIVDNFDEGGIPISPGVIHKDAIAAFHEYVITACCECGHDQPFAGRRAIINMPSTLAVKKAQLAHTCQGVVGINITDRQAELAGTAVHIQGTGAEGDILPQTVKIIERNEIHEQTVQMPIVEHQTFHFSNVFRSSRTRKIFVAEFLKTLEDSVFQ